MILSTSADSAAYSKPKTNASWPSTQIPSPSLRLHPSVSQATQSSTHQIITEVIHYVIFERIHCLYAPWPVIIILCSCFDCQSCVWEAGCEYPVHAGCGQWNSSGRIADHFGTSFKPWLFCSRSWYVVAIYVSACLAELPFAVRNVLLTF